MSFHLTSFLTSTYLYLFLTSTVSFPVASALSLSTDVLIVPSPVASNVTLTYPSGVLPGFSGSGTITAGLSVYFAVNVTGVSPTFPVLSANFVFPSNQATNFFVTSVGVGLDGSATATGFAFLACSQVNVFFTS